MTFSAFFLKNKYYLLLIILIIFHLVGIVGIQSDARAYFLSLSPMNLFLSVICLFLSYRELSIKIFVDVILIALGGFVIEWIGVHTHFLFGNYWYGANLGSKLDGIPLIIALNWVLLCWCSASLVLKFKIPILFKAIFSASLMTALDVLIEPVAMKSDFWHWKGGEVPFSNYFWWWVFAFFFHLYLFRRKTIQQNKVSIGLFIILTLFFAFLNL